MHDKFGHGKKKNMFLRAFKNMKKHYSNTAKTSADKKHFPRTQKFSKGTKYSSHTENRRRKKELLCMGNGEKSKRKKRTISSPLSNRSFCQQ